MKLKIVAYAGIIILTGLSLLFAYTTYQKGDVVIGQSSFSTSGINGVNTISGAVISYPADVAIGGDKLFVCDTKNSRVLIFNSVPTVNSASADIVLGQVDFSTNIPNSTGLNVSSLNYPGGIASNGSILIVADTKNNRVLVWNTIPAINNQQADVVLGQSDFSSRNPNKGQNNPDASTLNGPTGVATDGTRLFVSDTQNNRVLIWNSIPIANGAPADVVLGQDDFLSNTPNRRGINADSFYVPTDLTTGGSKLFIVDTGNNRVLVYNSIPVTNGWSADIAIGQFFPFIFNMANPSGAPDARSLNFPNGVSTDGTSLLIADTWNNRVLKFNSIPTENYPAADEVIGQPDFTSMENNNPQIGASTVFWPYSVAVSGTNIIVADTYNNRLLIFNSIPIGSSANVVVGQSGFTSGSSNNREISATGLNQPYDVFSDGYRLFVGDTFNNRVLIWNNAAVTNGQPADVVLGQPDFISNQRNNGGMSASSLGMIDGLATDGKRLFVCDSDNFRVLIWNSIPITNHHPADVVLGQPDFTSNEINNGGICDRSFAWPCGIATDGRKLVISDWDNNRVLIWNNMPTTNYSAADIVLGQPLYTSNEPNNGGISASSLFWPSRMSTDGTKLFICDTGNNRVLIWNTFPTQNGQPADVVLGQPDFASNTANNGGVSNKTMFQPYGVVTDGKRLFVSDGPNNRVLIWETIPTVNFTPADIVIGQPDFRTSSFNPGGVGERGFANVSSIAVDGTRLFVADTDNNRVVIHSTKLGPTKPTALSETIAITGTSRVLNLDWQDSVGRVSVAYYEVEIDTSPTFGLPAIITLKTTATESKISIVISTLSEGIYYWRIRAIDQDNYFSEWNDTGTFTIATTGTTTGSSGTQYVYVTETERKCGLMGIEAVLLIGIILLSKRRRLIFK